MQPNKPPSLVVPEVVTLPREIDLYNAPRVCHELVNPLGGQTAVLIADVLLTEFCESLDSPV
jgi:hypothetical protein